MNLLPNHRSVHRLRALALGLAAASGFAAAVLVAVAMAKTFTLHVAKSATVTNQTGSSKRENILVTSRGMAVYTLSGDTISHPKCTKANGCFNFWPPVTVSSAKKLSKAPGIKGKLKVWHRAGLLQVTLAGRPLYRFVYDTSRAHATGEGMRTFGGTWRVVATGSPAGPGTTTGTSTSTSTTSTSPTTSTTATSTTTTTTTTTTTSTCSLYPPYC
jgi:predicted lipoprotein with Yx(FWY)xxD motif